MKISFVYITTKDAEEARKIGHILVSERLVACVNIIPGMESIYHWEGKITEDNETVMIAKTTSDSVPLIIEKVKSIHSYQVPCIIELPIDQGNSDYLTWIEKETVREKEALK